jgi:hypothetical protein
MLRPTLRSESPVLSARFDILKMQPDGNTYCVESAEDLDTATGRARILVKYFPGQYVIVDNATGDKTFIPPKQ